MRTLSFYQQCIIQQRPNSSDHYTPPPAAPTRTRSWSPGGCRRIRVPAWARAGDGSGRPPPVGGAGWPRTTASKRRSSKRRVEEGAGRPGPELHRSAEQQVEPSEFRSTTPATSSSCEATKRLDMNGGSDRVKGSACVSLERYILLMLTR